MANWPKGVEPQTEEEWLSRADGSQGPQMTASVVSLLKQLDYSLRSIVSMKQPQQKVDVVMQHQTEAFGDEGAKPAAAAKAGAKLKAAAKRTLKPKAATKAGSTDTSALMDALEALANQVSELQSQVAENNAFIKETHFGFVCLALGDPDTQASFDNPAIQDELLGSLQVGQGEA